MTREIYLTFYKYTRKGSIAKEAHESNIINSVIINYHCKLNQDITKAHLSKYKLFSEFCPTLGICAPRSRCVLYIGKNTCAMTKTLAPECKWIYLRNVSVEKHTSPRRTNAWRSKTTRRLPAVTNMFSVYVKVYSKMISFNCQNIFTKKMNAIKKKRIFCRI